jgi:hypothetical protein
MLSIVNQEDKPFSIFFVSFASLKEEDELLEGRLVYSEVILDEEFHCLAQKDGVLILNANISDQSNKGAVNILFIFKLLHMCDYLLKVFLLRVKGKSLKDALVSEMSHTDLLL